MKAGILRSERVWAVPSSNRGSITVFLPLVRSSRDCSGYDWMNWLLMEMFRLPWSETLLGV